MLDSDGRSKVPEVSVAFWLTKIAATTLGETAGDAVSMSLDLGYLVGTFVFLALFIVSAGAQIRATRFRPFLYWATVTATTTVGTTLADLVTRSFGIGYPGGTGLLSALLMLSFLAWYRSAGTVSVNSITSPRVEMFYWVTIMFSQTLGTALGDWTADTAGFGYAGAALLFGAALAILVVLYLLTKASRTALFWAAFILTRPLGAVLGDFLDKPLDAGGLALDRFAASASLLAFMVACILLARSRPAGAPPG